MFIIKCDYGHYYDSDAYTACPHCGTVGKELWENKNKDNSVEGKFIKCDKCGNVYNALYQKGCPECNRKRSLYRKYFDIDYTRDKDCVVKCQNGHDYNINENKYCPLCSRGGVSSISGGTFSRIFGSQDRKEFVKCNKGHIYSLKIFKKCPYCSCDYNIDALLNEYKGEYIGKNFSVLGDDIGTCESYKFACMAELSDINSSDDIYSSKVVKFFGGKLLEDISDRQRTVLGCNKDTVKRLSSGDIEPDVIIVELGVNDCLKQISPYIFKKKYEKLIENIQEIYPNSELWCLSVPQIFVPVIDCHDEYDAETGINVRYAPVERPVGVYNDIIYSLKSAKVKFLEIGRGLTDSEDTGDHLPNKSGMNKIAYDIFAQICGIDVYGNSGTDNKRYCAFCSSEVSEKAIFCPMCGAKLFAEENDNDKPLSLF